ncbi:MAG: dephospho-CoA kinase [Pseudomonadota bacterium]
MTNTPILIGLTGSIGMGKSTTAQIFAEYGFPIWDADAAVMRLYAKGGAAVAPMMDLVPGAILNGGISKDALKLEIKKSPDLLLKIESLVHPLVKQDRRDFAAAHQNAEMIIFDVPLLFETGAHKKVDHVVVVSTTPENQRARVLARGTMDEPTFNMIMRKQTPDAEKRAGADTVIDTATLDGARAQVHALVEQLRG